MRFLYFFFLLLSVSCNKEERSDDFEYRIKGETITLNNNEFNQLLQENVSDIFVYSLDPEGNIIQYIENKDYVVEENRIRRTEKSSIPNFANYNVAYQPDGKFEWIPEPNLNPPLPLLYQVYVDYRYKETNAADIILPSITLNKERLTRTLKIVGSGTSITTGIHTYNHYFTNSDSQTYLYLLARAIKRIYNNEVVVVNKSINGGRINQIVNLEPILSENPDIVIIELGMNDHCGEVPDQVTFKNSIDRAVKLLKENEIEVILVGFFQQNPDWELEYPHNTRIFNDILKDIASQHNIFFADIYTAFEKLDKMKLYKDYMGDFMHHPTSFGHQLYYLEIMPFFLTNPVPRSDLWEYIY